MLGVAISCPVRLKNFAQIKLGHELKLANGDWHLTFEDTSTKNEVTLKFHIPETLAATFLAKNSVSDLYHASRLLGHRDLRTTEVHYIRASQLTASRKVNHVLEDLAAEPSAKHQHRRNK